MRKEFETMQASQPVARRCFLATAAVSLVLGYFGLGPAAFAQKQERSTTATIQRLERFQAVATLLGKSGKSVAVHAAVHEWTILGEQRIPEFQEHDFLLVQLLGGKVTTVIDGKEQRRAKGEFWVVPANAKMSINATGETASLEVTTLSIS
jgi:quercetin dioxygenase-like cupin family protein